MGLSSPPSIVINGIGVTCGIIAISQGFYPVGILLIVASIAITALLRPRKTALYLTMPLPAYLEGYLANYGILPYQSVEPNLWIYQTPADVKLTLNQQGHGAISNTQGVTLAEIHPDGEELRLYYPRL